MHHARNLMPMMLAILLAACRVEVPSEKSAYVGEWKAEAMSLLITRDGSIHYQRQQKGASTSINAPLKAFSGDDFEVGIGPMTTLFKVSSPPHQRDGKWKMTVDGIELTRVD